MRIRPGGVGEGNLLKRTASGEAEMLDCEFVIVDGEFVKRKFWDTFILEGTTDGQREMARTNRGRLKKILESARGKHVIFVGIQEKVLDDFGRFVEFRLQMEGAKAPRELPAIVDEIIAMEFLDFGNHQPVRGFVCRAPNRWGLPAKDRSGKLDETEPPHLGKLLANSQPREACFITTSKIGDKYDIRLFED